MKVGDLVIAQMRNSQFAATRVIGILVERKGGVVKLSDCCIINEILSNTQTGYDLRPHYLSNSIYSEGVWEFDEQRDLCGGIRIVTKKEETIKFYDKALSEYRSALLPKAIPRAARNAAAREQ